jgi:hypothetical protein
LQSIKESREIAEKRNLLAKKLNPTIPNAELLTSEEKGKLTRLQKKYPFPGGAISKRNKKAFKKQMSKRQKKYINKSSRKNKMNKKHNHTKR